MLVEGIKLGRWELIRCWVKIDLIKHEFSVGKILSPRRQNWFG